MGGKTMKRYIALIVIVLFVFASAPTSAQGMPQRFEGSVIEVQFPNGGWLTCLQGSDFPYGMYDSPYPDSPEFQIACNSEYEAMSVYVDDVAIFLGDEDNTVVVNPFAGEIN